VHDGKADQASGYAAWPAPDFDSGPRRARTISLMREMLKVRLTDEFREAQGATYSPSASNAHSTAFPGYGVIVATAETRPELVDGFFKTLDGVTEELRSGKFTDDLLNRARTPIVQSIQKSRLTNGFWAGVVTEAQTRPQSLEAIRSQIGDYEGITREEITSAAKVWLDPARRIDIRVLPRRGAAASPAAGGKDGGKQP
jgi:zinc protease